MDPADAIKIARIEAMLPELSSLRLDMVLDFVTYLSEREHEPDPVLDGPDEAPPPHEDWDNVVDDSTWYDPQERFRFDQN
ncbi:MAG: hypothetical protein M3Q65_14985 [Chloroflexota bacterium]|nr:hypothetical protein [Chloroflexota bacterium]